MRLSRIVTDVSSSLKMLWRNKGSLFWMIAFPVMLMVIFGAIFSMEGGTNLTLYIQDNDGTALSQNFTGVLNSTGAFDIHYLDTGIDLEETIQDEEIHRILIIPSNFTESLFMNGSASITLRQDPTDQTTASATSQIVRAVVYEFNKQFANSSREISVNELGIVLEQEFRYIDFFLPGVLGMTIMTSGIYGSIAVNTRYRKNGILRKVATTPMTKAEWVISKVLYQIVVAFISMTALIVVAVLAYGVEVSINPLVVLLVVTGSMTFSGIGMIVARFVKDEEAAESAGGAINFPMMFLSGIFFPLEFMPGYLQAIGKVMPLYYVGQGLRDAMINLDYEGALFSAAIVFTLAVVLIAIGAVVSSWTDE